LVPRATGPPSSPSRPRRGASSRSAHRRGWRMMLFAALLFIDQPPSTSNGGGLLARAPPPPCQTQVSKTRWNRAIPVVEFSLRGTFSRVGARECGTVQFPQLVLLLLRESGNGVRAERPDFGEHFHLLTDGRGRATFTYTAEWLVLLSLTADLYVGFVELRTAWRPAGACHGDRRRRTTRGLHRGPPQDGRRIRDGFIKGVGPAERLPFRYFGIKRRPSSQQVNPDTPWQRVSKDKGRCVWSSLVVMGCTQFGGFVGTWG